MKRHPLTLGPALAALVLFFTMIGFGPLDAAAAPSGAIPSVLAGIHQTSVDEQLIKAYTPVVMVKRQRHACDADGEAFLPAPVDVVLDDPLVTLRQQSGRGSDPVLETAPSMADIAGLDDTHYLDFPGNSRNPGCGYEQWFKSRMPNFVPTTYANLVVDAERHRVIVQFWFWYVFNDFNNTHEGDWEMIQVVFSAGSAEEALANGPLEVGFSQHSGGERADWTDAKLHKEGTRPVVYAASGSHASNYGSEVYLAWGEDSTGFGCDVTTGPSDRIDVVPIYVKNGMENTTGPLAWASFEGRWGERQRAFYNGPHGPAVRERWYDPMPWQERLRDSSLIVPAATTLGPGPTNLFCGVTKVVSLGLTRAAVYPGVVFGLLGCIVLIAVLLSRVGGASLAEAWRIFWRRWPTFLTLGLLLIPVGIVANLAQSWVTSHPPGEQLFGTLNSTPGARFAFVLGIGGVQQLIGLLIVGPAVIEAVAELQAGRRGTFFSAFRRLGRDVKRLAAALVRPALIIALLSFSVIGIPWAIERTVRWWFVVQAVLMDGVPPHDAAAASARLVSGRWWRTALTCLFLSLFAISAGPILGIFFLIVASPSIRYVNALSSIVFSVMIPMAVIGSTVLYASLKRQQAGEAPALSTTAGDAERFDAMPVSPSA